MGEVERGRMTELTGVKQVKEVKPKKKKGRSIFQVVRDRIEQGECFQRKQTPRGVRRGKISCE